MSNSSSFKPVKYDLALCELFHPVAHGLDDLSSPAIEHHFLIYSTYTLAQFTEGSYQYEERCLRRHWGSSNLRLHWGSSNLQYNKKYIRLEIIQADELQPGAERVAYFKTFWLRIVQRCWKKVFKARKALIQKRSSIKALQEKQRTGQWPQGLRNYPAFTLGLP
jgi:hypothetical protein